MELVEIVLGNGLIVVAGLMLYLIIETWKQTMETEK